MLINVLNDTMTARPSWSSQNKTDLTRDDKPAATGSRFLNFAAQFVQMRRPVTAPRLSLQDANEFNATQASKQNLRDPDPQKTQKRQTASNRFASYLEDMNASALSQSQSILEHGHNGLPTSAAKFSGVATTPTTSRRRGSGLADLAAEIRQNPVVVAQVEIAPPAVAETSFKASSLQSDVEKTLAKQKEELERLQERAQKEVQKQKSQQR